MTKSDEIPDLESHIKAYKPKRFAGDDEELQPGIDREIHMIRSRAGGSKLGSQMGSRLGGKQ